MLRRTWPRRAFLIFPSHYHPIPELPGMTTAGNVPTLCYNPGGNSILPLGLLGFLPHFKNQPPILHFGTVPPQRWLKIMMFPHCTGTVWDGDFWVLLCSDGATLISPNPGHSWHPATLIFKMSQFLPGSSATQKSPFWGRYSSTLFPDA